METLVEEDEDNHKNDEHKQDGENPQFSSRNDAMNVLHQSVKFNTEIKMSKLRQSIKFEELQKQDTMLVSDNEGIKSEAKTHGNRVMAGKEFNFLHKMEIKKGFEKLGKFKAHDTVFYFSRTSLFVLTSESRIRKWIVWLITWK